MEKTALIYARQSFTANGEEQSVSIEVQIENCKRWAKKNNVNVLGIFSDANVSSECFPLCESGIESARCDRAFQKWRAEQRTKGRKEYKEGLGKAFDAIATQHPDYIIVNTTNRLGRSATNSNLNNYMTAYFMDNQCSVVDVTANNITDFSDRIMMAFRAMKDALDYNSVFEKRKSSMESVGKRIDSYNKFSNAYGVEMRNKTVCFNAEIAEAVRYVFQSMADGAAYSQILHTLNTEYKGLARGRQWYMSNIRAILSNLTYCGYMKNREGVIDRAKNIPEPVVSYALYQKANEMAERKKTNAAKYNLKENDRRHFLPLSGYLKCSCGRRLTMFVDRGKIGYHCINNDGHRTAIYVDDDVLQTIQCFFAFNVIESRKTLANLKRASERIDSLKSELQKLDASLKAKFMAIQSDEDAELFKDIIANIKARRAQAKAELIEAEAIGKGEKEEFERQLQEDMYKIMARELMPQKDYMRLLQETINEIVVEEKKITVRMQNGVSIDVPRLKGKHNAKRLMKCRLIVDTPANNNSVEGIVHYQLHFYDGEFNDDFENDRVVFGDADISVFIQD